MQTVLISDSPESEAAGRDPQVHVFNLGTWGTEVPSSPEEVPLETRDKQRIARTVPACALWFVAWEKRVVRPAPRAAPHASKACASLRSRRGAGSTPGSLDGTIDDERGRAVAGISRRNTV